MAAKKRLTLQGVDEGPLVEKTPVKETQLSNDSKNNFLDKEVDIKINPRRIFKGVLSIALIALIFFSGMFVGEFTSLTGAVFSDSEDINVEKAEVETPEPEVKVEPVVEETKEAETTETEIEEPVVEEAEESTVQVVVTENEPAEVISEKIITKYTKVTLEVRDVQVDWKETWGKITHIDYTIKNEEDGTILPGYINMKVEGYDKFDKKIDLPKSSQKVTSGKNAGANILIPSGFSYSENTAGDLTNVQIWFTLFDQDANPIASFSKEFNLLR